MEVLSRGLLVRLEAKPGKENQVLDLLTKALYIVRHETDTPLWFALRLGPSTFGVFDAFANESIRLAHLEGPVAKALIEHADDLLAAPISIEYVEIPAYKLSKEGLDQTWEVFDDAG